MKNISSPDYKAGAESPRIWRRAELVAEVRLLSYSDCIDSIAARMGMQVKSLQQALRRAGEARLIEQITPLSLRDHHSEQERAA